MDHGAVNHLRTCPGCVCCTPCPPWSSSCAVFSKTKPSAPDWLLWPSCWATKKAWSAMSSARKSILKRFTTTKNICGMRWDEWKLASKRVNAKELQETNATWSEHKRWSRIHQVFTQFVWCWRSRNFLTKITIQIPYGIPGRCWAPDFIRYKVHLVKNAWL